jgi:hypothetical protein
MFLLAMVLRKGAAEDLTGWQYWYYICTCTYIYIYVCIYVLSPYFVLDLSEERGYGMIVRALPRFIRLPVKVECLVQKESVRYDKGSFFGASMEEAWRVYVDDTSYR